MEVICVSEDYDNETLSFWHKHGVIHPKQDAIYNINSQKKHSNGKIGVTLEEINNPKVPIDHHILRIIMMDVTFSINRFRKLNGEKVKAKELENVDIII